MTPFYKSESVSFIKFSSETEFASFVFESKTPNVRVTKAGRQRSAKLSRVVGRVSALRPGRHPLLCNFVCRKLRTLTPESLWVLRINN
jgi:hypothetical protein